jgi:hypothetical protein
MTRTESKWAERVAQWRASGQTVTEYARGREYQASTLRWWSSRVGRGVVERSSGASVRMVRVVAAAKPSESALSVRVGGVLVEIRPGFDVALLREVVHALGGER